jgi:hypothetical protein
MMHEIIGTAILGALFYRPFRNVFAFYEDAKQVRQNENGSNNYINNKNF